MIIARRLSFESASARVEMEERPAPSIQSEPANMESTAFCTSESAALRVPFGGAATGLSDRELSPELSEGRARAMYDRIATYIEEVRTALRIDVTEAVYIPQRVYIRVAWKNYDPLVRRGLNASPSLWRASEH